MRHSMRGCRNKKGFTLVELVVVLILISVVAAIAVPSYLGYVDDTKERQCELNRKRLAAYLDDARVMSSDVEEIFKKYTSDSDDAIKCPAGGEYDSNASGTGVVCSIPEHGGTVVIGRHENVVTADAGVDAGTKDETVSGGEGTNPPSTGGNGGNNGEGGSGDNGGNGEDSGNGGNSGNSTNGDNGNNGGSSTNGGNNEETEPAITVMVTPNELPLKTGESGALSAEIAVTNGELDLASVQWSSDNPAVAKVSGNGSKNASVTAVGEGECTITCTATAYSPNKTKSKSGFGTAKVTVSKAPVNLHVSIFPNPATVTEGTTTSLTANVTPSDVACNYSWGISEGDGATLESWNGNQAVVKGVTAGSTVTVTCTATPTDSSIVLAEESVQTASAALTVEERVPAGDLLKNVPNPLLINGMTGGIDIAQYENITPGEWTSDNSEIVECPAGVYNKRLTAKGRGFCNLTYTSGGKFQTIRAKVVYPHTHLNVNGAPDSGNTIRVNDTVTMTAVYGDTSTDGPVQWINQSLGIITISAEGENNEIAKVTATDIGTANILVRLQNEFTGEWSEVPISYPVYTDLTGIRIEPQTYELMKGQTAKITLADGDGDIKIYPVPETASLEGASIKCESRSTYHVGVLNTGEIQGLNEGNNIGIHVTVSKDGSEYAGDFTVNVKQDPSALSQIGVATMNLRVGQEPCKISFWTNPGGIDLSAFTFQYTGYDESCIQIDPDQNTIRGLKPGKTTVSVKALRNGAEAASCTFDVIVSNIDNIWCEPGSISDLKVGQEQDVQIRWQPEDADVSDIVFEITDYEPKIVEITSKGSGKFTLKGISGNTHWLTARAKLSDGTVLKEYSFQVTVQAGNGAANEQTTVEVEGVNVTPTPWEELRNQLKEAVKNGTVRELLRSALFLQYPNAGNWNLYILGENADIKEWDESYDNMTFEQFLQVNQDVFYSLNRYYVPTFPDNLSEAADGFWVSYNYGQLIKRNGHLYVAMQQIPNSQVKSWTDEMFNQYFVVLQ